MKKWKNIARICLIVVLCLSMSVSALAESAASTVDSSAGEIDVTVTVEQDEDSTVTTVTTEEGGVLTGEGTLVEYQEQTTETIVTDENGQTGTETIVEGSETTERPADPTNANELSGSLIVDGELQGEDNGDGTHTVTMTGESSTEPTDEGDKLQSEDPENYDQTTTTDTRQVEVTVSEPTVSTGTIIYLDENGNPIELHPTDDGYAFSSNYAKNYIFDVNGEAVDPQNPGESVGVVDIIVKDADGNVVDKVEDAAIVQFKVINNETGESHMKVYCVDATTGVHNAFNYRRTNLEDAVAEGYYSEDEAKHLRAILTHGYDWSDGAETGENLDEIKSMMLEALEAGEITGVTADEINAMTGTEAATATGMAIWQYGNRFEVPETGSIVMTGTEGNNAINALYQYLITLEEEAPETETQIINEEKFVKDMDITVGKMVEDNAFNQDTDLDNDVYHVDLSFSLVVEPDPENDDLIVKVVDGVGNVIRSARIAGEGRDESDKLYDGIELSKNDNGETVYTFTDLQLQENSDTTFNLTLEGAQLLQEGVYVYKAKEAADGMGAAQEMAEYYKQMGEFKGYEEGYYKHHLEATTKKYFVQDENGNYVPKNPEDTYTWEEAEAELLATWAAKYDAIGLRTSQNFIGIMSGYADVDVSMSVDLTFNVEEGTIRTEREWYSYTAPEFEPIEITPPPTEREEPVVYSELPDEEPPLSEEPEVVEEEGTEIPEEEVPMAEYEEIPEVELPLADVPQTGDASALWIVLAVLSLTGLAALSFGKKRAA